MKCEICLRAINALKYKQIEWEQEREREKQEKRPKIEGNETEKTSMFVCVWYSEIKDKVHSKFMWCLQNIHINFNAILFLAPFTTQVLM